MREKTALTSDLTMKVAQQTKELSSLKISEEQHAKEAATAQSQLEELQKEFQTAKQEAVTAANDLVTTRNVLEEKQKQILELEKIAELQIAEGEKLQGQIKDAGPGYSEEGAVTKRGGI
eukprot:symbB.v1.2.037156.t1/scaffold5404.1/size27511/5